MDDEEYLTLIQRLGPKLYRFFLSRGTKTDAEESVQEVFTRLIERLNAAAFNKDLGNSDSYAWGIAMNLRRERARSREISVVDQDYEVVDPASLPVPGAENFVALKKAVQTLGEPERTILQLLLADMQISEISAVLNMPNGTVKSHIHRGKENIRAILRKWGVL